MRRPSTLPAALTVARPRWRWQEYIEESRQAMEKIRTRGVSSLAAAGEALSGLRVQVDGGNGKVVTLLNDRCAPPPPSPAGACIARWPTCSPRSASYVWLPCALAICSIAHWLPPAQ